jgi:hypothetical protein
MDPQPGSSGFGYAVARTRSQARNAAVVTCAQTAGSGRAPACKVVGTDCD